MHSGMLCAPSNCRSRPSPHPSRRRPHSAGRSHCASASSAPRRRSLDAGTSIAQVEGELIRRYRIYPAIVQHYDVAAAFAQKVAALAQRSETQARDVFDLDLLLTAGGAPALDAAQRKLLPAAIDRAMTIGFDDFRGQVAAYLEPENQAEFAERAVWEMLQERVVDALRALES
jgi:hypothetical protein